MRIRIVKEEEDFTPIANPKEKQPAAKQFQILASMITNTKVNDQTNILSAMRALPGVTIVNSQAAIPGSNSEGQLRYKTNVDIKIDTSALEGDIKAGIRKIVDDIKKIEGVVEFKVLPKAKETTPY
jgi:ACT domain-containing protein